MYARWKSLTDIISNVNKTLELPRDGIIDKILVVLTAKLANSDTSNSQDTSIEEVAKSFIVRVESDRENTHVALRFDDIIRIMYYDRLGKTVKLTETVSVPAGGTKDVKLPILIEFGDIHAYAKDDLTITIELDPQLTNANLSIDGYTAEVSVREKFLDPEEFVAVFGKEGELIAEPKVVAFEKDIVASTELRTALDLPVGTLLRRAFLVVYDTSEKTSDNVVDKYAVVAKRGAELNLYEILWTHSKELDRLQYAVEPLQGVTVLDYGLEITRDGLGLRGWHFNKGDIVLAVKASANGKIRYISHEYVVASPELADMGSVVLEV